jgi:hypothetical protein
LLEQLRVLTGRQCCREQQIRHLDGEDRRARRLRGEPALQRGGEGSARIRRRDHGHNSDVDDALFARLRRHYDEDTIAELTMIIAWENASSRFNRAFRIPSQEFWKR